MREERVYHARLCQEKPKMFSMRCLLTLAMLSVFCHLSCLATPGSSDSIAYRFRRQLEVFPQEKIYVHTDRSSYQSGDTIWLRAHLVDASTHQSTTQSRYVYVELIDVDSKVLKRIKLRPDKNSVYHGYLPIHGEQPQGYYTLRAYTRFMENLPESYFFHSDIAISNPHGRKTSAEEINEDKKRKKKDTLSYRPPFHVSFFPEGGYLPTGVRWRVAFKAVGEDGWSEEVYGAVVESVTGDTVATLSSAHRGMGQFMMTAEKGKRYVARVLNHKNRYLEFELPQAEDDVPMLAAYWVKNRLGVTLSHPNREGLRLVMHTRGQVFYNEQWNPASPILFVNKQQLPGGVIQLLLIDDADNVLSERLIFNRSEEELKTTLTTDKTEYGRRERVNVETLLDRMVEDSLQLGNFSASVCLSEDEGTTAAPDINTYLLLTSEVKGNIELAETYFKENDKKSEQQLDLLMLTQGWRRYDIYKIASGKLKQPQSAREIGQEIQGQVVRELSGRPFNGAPILLTIPKYRFYEEKKTDSLGRFSFTHLEFPDSTKYILRGLSHKNKSHDVLTKIKEEVFPKIYKPALIRTLLMRPAIKKELEINVLSDSTIRLIELGEVKVTATIPRYRVSENGFIPRSCTSTFDEKYYLKKQCYDIVDLLNVTPYVDCNGVYITVRNSAAFNGRGKVYARPVILINDERCYDSDVLNLHPEDIEEVSVVRRTFASIYRFEASTMLVIYTKPGVKILSRFAKVNIQGHIPLGYQVPVEFYSPKYVAQVKGGNDERRTLHWEPCVGVSQAGKGGFSFYTGDRKGEYIVVVQGVTVDGEIIHAKQKFTVK